MSRYLLPFLKCILHQLNFLLLKTVFGHSKCFLSSVAKDGKDGQGLKLENNAPTFSSFNAMPAKNTEKLLLIILSYVFITLQEHFAYGCYGTK